MQYGVLLIFLGLWLILLAPVAQGFDAYQRLLDSPAITAGVPGVVRQLWGAWYPVLGLVFTAALAALGLRHLR